MRLNVCGSCDHHSMNKHVSPVEREQMIQAAVGLITAKIAGADELVQRQLADIVRDQVEASSCDLSVFAGRMAKQVEAARVVSWTLIKMLAPRLNLSQEKLNQVLGEVAAGDLPLPD